LEHDGWTAPDRIVQLSDGSLAAIGRSWSSGEKGRPWLIKLSLAGEVLWLKQAVLTGFEELRISSMGAGQNGDIVLTGTLYSGPSGGPDPHSITVLLDPDGDVRSIFDDNGSYMQLLEGGGYLMSPSLGVRGLDAEGRLVWSKTLSLGESQNQPPHDLPFIAREVVSMTATGELLFSGSTAYMVANPGNPVRGQTDRILELWFVRFESSGQAVWKHQYVVNLPTILYGDRTSDGGLVSVGGYAPLQGGSEVPVEPIYTWAMKVDAQGGLIYQRRFLDLDRLSGAAATAEGGMVLFGEAPRKMISLSDGSETLAQHSDAMLIKLDAQGAVEWGRGFREGVVIRAVKPLLDGTYLISWWNWREADQDALVARLDTEGLLPGDPFLATHEIRVRDDGDPLKIDEGDDVPFALLDTTAEIKDELEEQRPILSFALLGDPTRIVYRSFPSAVDD
jgi:hypothetical protein